MSYDVNPFNKKDEDRYYLWEMLVRKDIDAFLKQDWNMVKDDFYERSFIGINANKSSNPDSWKNDFASLQDYKDSWLKQAKDFSNESFKDDKREALFRATILRDIDIKNDSALLHKKFDGIITKSSGEVDDIIWQTIYNCKKIDGAWKIVGFVGYLPNPMGFFKKGGKDIKIAGKSLPLNASQHKTAGPYSPVLNVSANEFVLISGQAPIDNEGNVVGEGIEEQTRFTLENCKKQLNSAGVDFEDVFKVNVYLTDLNLWERFNDVYKEIMPKPYPVRTAVKSGLLYTFLVEIEMWAIKR